MNLLLDNRDLIFFFFDNFIYSDWGSWTFNSFINLLFNKNGLGTRVVQENIHETLT